MSRRRTSINLTLVNLGVGELVAAGVFALFAAPAVIHADLPAAPVWSALAPLLVVLVQAGVYWLIRSGTHRSPTPMAASYRATQSLAQLGRRRTPRLMKDLALSRHAVRQHEGY